MYNILIVDDEYLARKTLKMFWNWTEHNCRIVGEASGAKEAISFLEHHDVDVAFVDVSMPEMDGIDLTAHINRHFPQTAVIIFSNYSDFQYIKNAFAENAVDYLLKHEINARTMQKVLDSLENRQKNDARAAAISSLEQEKAYRSRVISAVVGQTGDVFSHAVILALGIPGLTRKLQFYPESEKKLVYDNIDNLIAQIVSDITGFVIFPQDALFILYLPFDEEKSEPEIMQAIGRYVREMSYSIYRFFSLKLSFGISGLSSPSTSVHACFLEATDMLCHHPSVVNSAVPRPENINRLSISMERRLLNALSDLSVPGVFKCLEELFGDIRKSDNSILINELVAIAADFCSEYDLPPDILPAFGGESTGSTVCLAWAKEMFQSLIDACLRSGTANYQDTYIHQVTAYIAEHYSNEALSLEDIAGHVGMNKYYLSRTFKAKTGKSISSFLNDYRMEKARELLQKKEIPLKSCHFRLGFKDYSYFCTQFKKYEGMSPKKYRATH